MYINNFHMTSLTSLLLMSATEEVLHEDSAWREILYYFKNATHIGLTATPKETKEISNIEYFGDPLYTYSLKQGIDDGFLAPYKVIRVTLKYRYRRRMATGKGKRDKRWQ